MKDVMTDQVPDAPEPKAPGPLGLAGQSKELQLRVASGLGFAVLAFAMLYWGPFPFAILLALVAGAMSWEWNRIVRGGGEDAIAAVHIATTLVAAGVAVFDQTGLALAVVAIGAIVVAALAVGSGRSGLSGVGVLYTGLPVIALIWLRSDPSLGLLAVLFVLLAVAATDTAAYFTGRTVGGPKLWPAVSPNKTWSGLAGGVTAAALTGAVFPFLTGSGWWIWLSGLGLVLGLVAQAGDLAESALKRHFGVKDASDLIPGHGGFMDRMDGIVTASIAAALIAAASEAYAPARALLYGS
jgi:phosphatidate cytidylyltransferase